MTGAAMGKPAFGHWLCACIMFLVAIALPQAADAREDMPGIDHRCHAAASIETSIETVLEPGLEWTCSDRDWDHAREATWLRFDLDPSSQFQPSHVSLRHARFESVSVFALRDGQLISQQEFAQSVVEPALFGPFASVELDRQASDADTIFVRIARPDLSSVGAEARIVSDRDDIGFSRSTALLLAALAGLVLMPLLFDLSLFAVLRYRFTLAHAGMCMGMLLVLCASNGLFVAVADWTVHELVSLAEVGFVIIVASAGAFFLTFAEPSSIPVRVRQAVKGATAFLLATSGLIALDLPVLAWIDQNLYMIGFVPMQMVVLSAMLIAISKGSKLVWFIVAGWLPAMIVGYDMVANGMGWQASRTLGITAPYYAMGLEVCITAIGVVWRIMDLRRERDEALLDVETLEDVSRRDPLTGLLNRRAIQKSFDGLADSGYSAMAVYDVDDFKMVNDDYGHDVGDEVLVAMARALSPGPDTIAVRLGGEEFLLLLRGSNALEVAEMRRTQLTELVRRSVPAVKRPVTASMGVVLFDDAANTQDRDFARVYALADRLLYQAKSAGKNTYQFEVLSDPTDEVKRSSAA